MDDLHKQLDVLLHETGWMDSLRLYELLDSGAGAKPADSIKHIAISYPGIGVGGGVERVIVLLSGLLAGAGYTVTVATDGTTESEYDLPPGVRRLVLPHKRLEKLEAMRTYTREHKVDLWQFNAYWRDETLYCLAYMKLLGCRTAVTVHVSFFMLMYAGEASFYPTAISAFNYADAVTCLTYCDYLWWRGAGCATAVHVPNPLTFDPQLVPKTDGKNRNVVFVARLSQVFGQNKGTYMLPDLIRMVADSVPDVVFTLVGEFDTGAELAAFRGMLAERGVEERVEMVGKVANISPYLQKSSALVMLSNVEGCPMVRREAQAHGLPMVYFELGYLEPCGPEYGNVMVGKTDVKGMAAEVVKLLTDREHWLALAKNTPRGLEGLSGKDIVGHWEALFRSIVSDSVRKDYQPPEMVEYRHIVTTIHESLSANQSLADRYSYLGSVDRKLNKLFPKMTTRRNVIGQWAKRIHEYAYQRRMARRRRRQ